MSVVCYIIGFILIILSLLISFNVFTTPPDYIIGGVAFRALAGVYWTLAEIRDHLHKEDK